jgi:predicted DNA binding CopG/RHH family protein
MKKAVKPIPKFGSESEERAFWQNPSNDTTDYFDFSKAELVEFPNLRPSTKTISIRLPESLLDRIRVQANKLDVPYQSLMKVWLSEKVEQAALASTKRGSLKNRGTHARETA